MKLGVQHVSPLWFAATRMFLGALSLFALFTLLNLMGLPQPLRETVQGLILIAAVASSAWRMRRA